MNLIEILNNSILLEAVRINNGREAYELIKNNRLGVKIHPSYKSNNGNIVNYLDRLINSAGANDAVFAVQLAANKIPAEELPSMIETKDLVNVIKYRNRPWAKNISEYKDLISFNNKECKVSEFARMLSKLKEEEQKHGHGDRKEVKTLYNDGTWSLQIPSTFKAAKAISFYGKKGEEQIPTKWCTRANELYFNRYSKSSPLYVIRNWSNGKSYQVAFDHKDAHFLDQDDLKGDEITKGDLTSIPDKLLSFIKWNGRTLKDYKDSEEKNRKSNDIKRGSSFKDPSYDLSEARWGKNIKVSNNVIKNIWENYADAIGNDKMTSYMVQKKDPTYVKHNGWWAAKYWFRNEPDFFILMAKTLGEEGFQPTYYWDGDDGLEELDKQDFGENIPEADELLEIAKKDIGQSKFEERSNRLRSNHLGKSNAFEKEAIKNFNNIVINDLTKLADKYSKGLRFKLDDITINKYVGGFIPYEITLSLTKDNRSISPFFIKKPVGLEYTLSKINYDYDSIENLLKGNTDKFLSEFIPALNKSIMKYYKQAMKDKTGLRLRNNAKIVDSRNNEIDTSNPLKRVYYEDYFPY